MSRWLKTSVEMREDTGRDAHELSGSGVHVRLRRIFRARTSNEEVVVGLLIGGVTLAGLVYYMYKSWGMPPVVSSVTNNEKELIQTI